jgi:Antitoxin Xre/MbcA/ParS C-terminal toxin-binding domain
MRAPKLKDRAPGKNAGAAPAPSGRDHGHGLTKVADRTAEVRLLEGLAADAVIDIADVAEFFGTSKSHLAESLGIARETLYKKARFEAPKTQTRLREMLEILSRVSTWAGGKRQAMAWYRAQPIAAFGGRTAESLVKSGQASTLRDYLDHIALGGYA